METNRAIVITLLANEGIILEFGGTKFLIDGLHENLEGVFSGLSQSVLDDLMCGEKPLFQNIEYILYTHCHYDHFSAPLTELFLKQHPVKGLLMPDRQTDQYAALRDIAQHRADRLWLLDLPIGEKQDIRLRADLSLTVFRSFHAGKQYLDVENFCYVLNLDGRKLLIIADAAEDAEYFSKMLAGEEIEIALVNPMFVNRFGGRKVINEAIRPEKLIVYHIPFADRGEHGFRKIVPHDVKKYQGILPPITVLWDELQEITI